MKWQILVLIFIAFEPAFAQSKVQAWMKVVAHNQVLSADFDEAARHNSALLKTGDRVNCSNDQELKVISMQFKDGTTADYLVSEVDGYVWFKRKFKILTPKNGSLVSTVHKVEFSASYNGWRFETRPELAITCDSCDRFKDVEGWTLSEIAYPIAMGCEIEAPKPVSPNDDDQIAILNTQSTR